MKKNYFNQESQFATKIGSACCIILLILFFLLGSKANAQVSITKPNLSITTCSGFPTPYSILDDIVIDETSNSNFSSSGSSKTLVLTAPANFEFKPGVGTVSVLSGKNITLGGSPITITATTVTITYTCSGTNKSDEMTIGDLQIRATNTASTGDIVRSSASTGTISGIATGTTFTNTLTSISVTAPAQATAFNSGTMSSTTFPMSFTGAADGYLVVFSSSSTPPSQPVDGTTYSAANIGSLGSGLTFVQSSSATSGTSTGLTGNTRYYYYIYAYNNCSGSPMYNTSGPLAGNDVTCSAVPNSVATSGLSTSGFTLNWSYPTGGSEVATTYIVQVTTDAGYVLNIPGSPFTVADPTTSLTLTGLNPLTTYYYKIKAKSLCGSANVTGNITTIGFPCTAPLAQATLMNFSSVTSSSISGGFTGLSDGYLVVCSTSTTPPTQPVNGTIYNSGTISSLGAGLTFLQSSNATTFSVSGLSGNTKYYFYVFAYTNALCTGGPIYKTGGALAGNATTCPAVPNSVNTWAITTSGFTLGWAYPTGGTAAAITYTIQITTDAGFTANVPGSPFTAPSAVTSLSVSGLTANTPYYYRVLASNGCSSSYVTGMVTTPLPTCVAPTSPANALFFGTITSTTIPATFSGAADGYLVLYSTTSTPPTLPVNGTTYSAANIATLGASLTFLQSGNSTTIATSGLTPNTKYYFFIYSYNNTACIGGPVYNTTALSGNARTCPGAPTSVNTSAVTQNGFTLNWTAPTGGTAAAITYIVQVCTDAAFTTDVIDSPYTVVDPITTLDITDLEGNVTYYYRIAASNGCYSTYVTGFIKTLTAPCEAPDQATSFTNGAVTSSTYPASFLGSADGFLVIQSTSATPPTQPVDGTLYTAANIAALGTGLTFIQSGPSYNISTTGLNGNTKYYYYVYAYTNSTHCTGGPVYNATGPLTANATTCPPAPSTITTSSITTTSFNLGWTSSTGGGASAVTYTVQITTNPNYTLNIAGSPFTVTNPTTSLNVTGLTSGTTYYYRVLASNGCASAYTTGYITTTITNDNCATAIPLTVNTTSVCSTATNGTTYGATQSLTLTSCSAYADDDVWYKFTATATSHTVTVTPSAVNTISDVVFQLYNACGGSTVGSCVNSYASAATETNTFTGLTVGTTYFVRIFSAGNGASYQGNFSICITTPVAPVNNDCSAAIALTVNSTTNCVTSTNGTTQYATQSSTGCTGTADDDVWYKFTATGTSHIVTVSPITLYDAVFQVFSSSCAGTSIKCTNATSGYAIESSILTGLTVGTTYYVRVYSYNNGSAYQGTFSICVTTQCSTGSGTGVSDTTCPNIVVGASGLNGAAPTPIKCYSTNTCTNLEAIYPDYNETTSYTVSSIPYAPPYQFNCLANPISVNVDDVWSNTITLPFNFCFYGNTYNKVLIGSNGALTFDTTHYSPGGYSEWSFSNNLPSSNLFLNAIFGVYNDIDPSKGGQVGWELVTLSSGCRALVAAWSDIPMYSTVCNNALYTGMIVLHENSNIIDVFIKEKNVCSTWNGGNAVVGIQNANATQAIVAPNRNSLDADWTVNQEAWRFSPSGASVASVKWYEGAGTTGAVVGNTATTNVCPTATTTYTAEVTYSFCNGVTSKYTGQTTVTISSGKTWTGAVSTDWSDPNNWSPAGVPTNQDCITIPSVTNKPVISGTGYNAYCYNLTVSNGSSLRADEKNNITVTDFVKVNGTGTFSIKDSASLVQINNTATNVGNITMERTAYVKAWDYVYWCSPVKNFSSGSLSPLSPSGYVFKWNPTLANGNGGFGNWVPGTETMALAKGYIAISPGSYSATVAAPLTATFNGVPYNGIRKPTISRGNYTGANYTGTNGATITNLDDNWNLVGNPYPSAISALSFLTLNTNVNGNVRLWTHGSPISSSNSNPFYGSFTQNYNVNDYVSYNGTGSTPPGFNGKIGAGQAFFVVMNDGAASSSTVTFQNSLRSAAYDNTQFYKNGNANTAASTENAEPEQEKSRIWLSLVDANSMAATTLVGYVDGATYDEDRLYDASHKADGTLGIYSWINDKTVIINGRPTPFDDNDYVNLGATIPADGTYNIGINEVDGLFNDDSQDIFLEDTQLNIVHNLRTAPYTFTAAAGDYTNRFVLKYKNNTLGNAQHETVNTYAYITNHNLNIKSDDNIKAIYLYDIAGKLINKFKPSVEANHFEVEFPYQNGVYLATVVKTSGEKATVKLLN